MARRKGRSRAGGTAPQRAPARARRREAWLLAAILVLTFAVHVRGLANQFIYFDDPDSVVNNPYIRHLGAAELGHWFTTPVQYMYMPVALASWAVDYQLGGLAPFVYHLHNLLLHLGCVALAYGVVRLLTGKPRVALLAALALGVHPVNVDTVASVSARTNLLAALFSLAALGAYGLSLERARRGRWLALSCAAFLVAALAKSAAVVLPLTLLLWDHSRGRRWSGRLLLEKLPFFAVALAVGIVALRMRVDVPPPVHYSAWNRAFVFLYALASYCGRLLAPLHLSMAYDFPVQHGAWLPAACYLAPLPVAAAVWGLHRLGVASRVLVFGLGFFVLHVGLSQAVLLLDGYMANRYAYLAYLGLFLVLAELHEQLRSAPLVASHRGLRVGAAAALAVWFAGLSALTVRRYPIWHDSVTLFDDVLAKQPGSAWVHGTRGLVRLHMGDLTGARADLDEALRLDPDYAPGLCYRGTVNYLTRDYPAALADLDRALARSPALSGAYRDRGKVKLALQDEDGALADFDRAIVLDPRSEAHLWRGMVRQARGALREALPDLDVAVANAPEDGEAFYLRGQVKLGLHDPAACADVATARRLGYQPPAGDPAADCP